MINSKVNKGCDYCNNHKWFSNDGRFSGMRISKNLHGVSVLECLNDKTPIKFCPFCGKQLNVSDNDITRLNL